MQKKLNDTTRCYPRTMDDAFQNSIERAQWFYPPERSTSFASVVMYALGICAWIGLAYLLVKG